MPLTVTARVSESERHLKDIYSLLHYEDKLFSTSEDGMVKVWDANLQLVGVFQAHQSVVYHIAIIKDTLYTCSNDGTIQAWNANTFEHIKTLISDENEICRLYVSNGQLFSGDDKGIVMAWEKDALKLAYNLIEEIRDLVVMNNLIYTVRDRDVVITEMLEGEKARFVIRKTIEGSSPMCIVGNKLCFATRTARGINVHDNDKKNTFKKLAEMEGHTMIINCLCGLGDNLLCSGSWDKNVKLWNLQTYQCIATCDVGYCVNAVAAAPQGQIYAGGSNGAMFRLDSK